MLDKTKARASVEQSIKLPDYFSCQNCVAWKGNYVSSPGHPLADKSGFVDMCYILQDRHTCAKQMLGQAIATGAVQIHLHLSNSAGLPVLTGGRP